MGAPAPNDAASQYQSLAKLLQQPIQKRHLAFQQMHPGVVNRKPTSAIDLRHFNLPVRPRRPLHPKGIARKLVGIAVAFSPPGYDFLPACLFYFAKRNEFVARGEACFFLKFTLSGN